MQAPSNETFGFSTVSFGFSGFAARRHAELQNLVITGDDKAVLFMVTVKMINQLDMPGQRFQAKLNVHLYWLEPGITQQSIDAIKLYENDPGGYLEEADIKQLGVVLPHVTKTNAFSVDSSSSFVRLAKEHPFGIVHREEQSLGTYLDDFNLRCFPFDAQDLQVHLRLDSKRDLARGRYVRSLISDETSVVMGDFTLAEWRLYSPQSRAKRTIFSVQLLLLRRHRYYTYNVIVANGLINTLGFTAYLIPPSSDDVFSSRSAVLLTLLLTSVAFKFVVSSELPKTPYFTLLDMYMYACFMMLLAIFLQSAVITYIITPDVVWPGVAPDDETVSYHDDARGPHFLLCAADTLAGLQLCVRDARQLLAALDLRTSRQGAGGRAVEFCHTLGHRDLREAATPVKNS